MMSSEPPSREDVSARWHEVARGEVSREDVSRWAEPLMFAEYDLRSDVLVMQALQYLHGFDMTYRSDDHRLVDHARQASMCAHSSRLRRSSMLGSIDAPPTMPTRKAGEPNVDGRPRRTSARNGSGASGTHSSRA
jgi:hypothetical protein